MSKTNPSPPYRLRLRLLAVHNDNNNLSDDDRKLVSSLLQHLAEGKNTADFFGVNNPSHRPTSPIVDQRIWDVCMAMAPKEFGGYELTKAEAIRYVASEHKIDEEKLVDNLKSKRGKALYEQYSTVFVHP